MVPASQPDSTSTDRVRTVAAVQRSGETALHAETVAVEEPLEIRLGASPLAVTMRTPGDDPDLALGFLLTEGILLGPAEIASLEPSRRAGESSVTVTLVPGVEVDAGRFQRSLFVSSSCGVCGKAAIENVRLFARPPRQYTISPVTLGGLTARLRRHQPAFDATGGLHAAGIFTPEGDLIAAREDVGRHNAVDKAIGAAARAHWPLPPTILVVSGRVSFEIVQKAAMAGIGAVVGVSAPSSLAVDLAQQLDMLLAGFARDGAFNVYAGAGRLGK